MPRPITLKTVQIHNECVCGYNEIDSAKEKMKWKDLLQAKAKVKSDSKTGERFFLLHFKYQQCNCYEN